MDARLATPHDHATLSAIVMHPSVRMANAHDGAPAFDPSRYTGSDGCSFAVIVSEPPPMMDGSGIPVGCFLAFAIERGAYTVHTNLLPSCRGSRALEAAAEALEFAFVRTDAEYFTTMVPDNNPRALWFAHWMGFRDTFKRKAQWLHGSVFHDVQHLRMDVDDWIQRLTMVEVGQHFHHALVERGGHVDHPDDAVHDAYVGAAWAMAAAGRLPKGMAIYNRFARCAGYEPYRLLGESPIRIDIGDCVLRADKDDFLIEEKAHA
jgi:hypothetical protein